MKYMNYKQKLKIMKRPISLLKMQTPSYPILKTALIALLVLCTSLSFSKVYPNPSSGYFEVSSTKTIKSIKVFMINGVLLSANEVSSLKTQLKIDKPGVYVIQFMSVSGEIDTQKLVIKK